MRNSYHHQHDLMDIGGATSAPTSTWWLSWVQPPLTLSCLLLFSQPRSHTHSVSVTWLWEPPQQSFVICLGAADWSEPVLKKSVKGHVWLGSDVEPILLCGPDHHLLSLRLCLSPEKWPDQPYHLVSCVLNIQGSRTWWYTPVSQYLEG